jgi:ribose transport system substrate-binding protein
MRATLLAGAGLLLVATGCGSSSSDTGAAASASAPLKGKTVMYIQTGSIPYYEYTKKGFEAAVKKLGGSPKSVNSNFDASAELANVQNAITQKVDAVVLEPLSSATVKAELRLLNAAKIPTSVLYGYSDDLKDQAVGFQEAQNLDTGKAAGTEMAQLVPTGDVAVITGTQGRADVDGYNAGFKSAFGDNARIVETYNGDYNRKTAFSAAQDLVTKHPDIKGIFVHNEDMAIGVIEALGSKAASVAIVTQNGSPDGVKYLKSGQVKASIGWSPTEEGAMSVQTLALHFQKKDRSTKLCLTPYAVNTQADPEKSLRWDDIDAVVAQGLKESCAEGSK